ILSLFSFYYFLRDFFRRRDWSVKLSNLIKSVLVELFEGVRKDFLFRYPKAVTSNDVFQILIFDKNVVVRKNEKDSFVVNICCNSMYKSLAISEQDKKIAC